MTIILMGMGSGPLPILPLPPLGGDAAILDRCTLTVQVEP
jgi:hypothetical protein